MTPEYDDSNQAFSFNKDGGWTQADLNELLRANAESGDDHHRNFCTMFVGDENGPVLWTTITVPRGSLNAIREYWESLVATRRGDEVYEKRRKNTETDPYWIEYDARIDAQEKERQTRLGDLSRCYFVLNDDCTVLNPPIERSGWEHPVSDEWNAFHNLPPSHPALKEIWDRRKLTYAEVVQRVSSMTIEPPPAGQRYHWYDRTD